MTEVIDGIGNRRLVPDNHKCSCMNCAPGTAHLAEYEPIHICMNELHGRTELGYTDWESTIPRADVCRN